MTDLATRLQDPTAWVAQSEINDAIALARAQWPALPLADVQWVPGSELPGASASEATYAAHPLIGPEVEGTTNDEIMHLVFVDNPMGTAVRTFWHELGHAIEWEALEERYPDSVIWATSNAEWTAPDNSVMADYWKARGLPGTFAQSLMSGHWGGLGYEEFAEDFAAVMCGSVPATDDSGVPIDRAKMLAFYKSLFPAPPPAPVVTPTPTVVTPTAVAPTTVVDFYGPHSADFYTCLASQGVSGIARYLVLDPTNDPRAVTAQEVADAHAAGLAVHFFFEMSPTYAQYFSEDNGRRDVRAAAWHLRSLGAPQGTVVYFSVDAPPSRVPPEVLTPYFNAIEDVLRNEGDGLIMPGLYGYEEHIEYARANYPHIKQHMAQTYGTPRGPLDLFQHEQREMCGVTVDIDDATVTGWKGDDMTADQVRAICADYIATVYGPELEKELQERFAAAAAADAANDKPADVGAIVAAAVAAVAQKLATK